LLLELLLGKVVLLLLLYLLLHLLSLLLLLNLGGGLADGSHQVKETISIFVTVFLLLACYLITF
jgi:hypothetical protein